MKKEYKKHCRGRCTKGRYVHQYARWHRKVRTMNELRQLHGDDNDGLPVRRRRLLLPTNWDDLPVSRNWKRSWKDFTKKRHQWEK